MRRAGAALLVAVVVAAAVLVATHRGAHAVGGGRLETLHLYAPGQDRIRDIVVYRPNVPDSADLPVVYFLHGLPGSANDVFDAGAKAILDRIFANGLAPFVLVAPDGNGIAHDDTEWANAVDGSDQLETWVTTTVREVVEGAHPRPASKRAIAGFSMGGYGAMNLAFHHPDLYRQVVSIAGYFHVDDPDHVFGGQAAVEAANTPLAHVAEARDMRVGIFDGDREDEPVIRGQAVALHDALTAVGIESTMRISPGSHDWDYAATVLADVFAFLSAGYR